MNVFTFINAGPHGVFEEGVVIEVDGKLITIHDGGVVELKPEHKFYQRVKVEPKDFLSAVIETNSLRIAHDVELQKKLLPLIKPSVVDTYLLERNKPIEDNEHGSIK